MNERGPYKLLWIGLLRWQLSIRWRPTWGCWIQRTDLFVIGIGTEEGM